MSLLAMAHPVPHTAFKREFAWEENRQPPYVTRPRAEPERFELPSIRQLIPELHSRILPPQESNNKAPPSLATSATSPVVGLGLSSVALPTPEYVHSPNLNKRRRLSSGDEREERASQIPRLYASPSRELPVPGSRGMSPSFGNRSATDSWSNSSRTSPYVPQNGNMFPQIRSPAALEGPERFEPRPTLPSLPHLSFDRRDSAPIPRIRGRSSDEDYSQGTPRPGLARPNESGMEAAGPPYRPNGYFSFQPQHPPRLQPISMGPMHPLERTPFSAGAYEGHYHEYIRYSDMGALGMNGDNKQRKRRGNLPKETTDKLRAWFVGHLNHPYPSEDEKQELMRQTGLQMNQISNWFINARRRQLPAMVNNDRAMSTAINNARHAEGKVLPSTERTDYDGKRGSVPLSEGEASPYEDDLETLKRRHVVGLKQRGSV